MMLGFPPVVQATVDGHRVVAVRCSQVRGCPWLTIDIEKGWTIARAEHELEEKVALSAVVASAKPREWQAKPSESFADGIVTRTFKLNLGPEARRILFGPFPTTEPKADRWRIEDADDGFDGTAAHMWFQFVLLVDGGSRVLRIEQLVDGTWRRRSVRDLLEAAGGDPL